MQQSQGRTIFLFQLSGFEGGRRQASSCRSGGWAVPETIERSIVSGGRQGYTSGGFLFPRRYPVDVPVVSCEGRRRAIGGPPVSWNVCHRWLVAGGTFFCHWRPLSVPHRGAAGLYLGALNATPQNSTPLDVPDLPDETRVATAPQAGSRPGWFIGHARGTPKACESSPTSRVTTNQHRSEWHESPARYRNARHSVIHRGSLGDRDSHRHAGERPFINAHVAFTLPGNLSSTRPFPLLTARWCSGNMAASCAVAPSSILGRAIVMGRDQYRNQRQGVMRQ